jgi:hypothetical protein
LSIAVSCCRGNRRLAPTFVVRLAQQYATHSDVGTTLPITIRDTRKPVSISDYMRDAFGRNAGPRIDHLLLSPPLGGAGLAVIMGRDQTC